MPLRPDAMSRQEFVAAFGGIFEHSPWIAEEIFDRGFDGQDDTAGLHKAMCRIMRAARHERQLALIRAHPDLAGKLAIEGRVTEASRSEQASAGLDRCSPEEFERFSRLNAEYTERFGFPFIMAVKGKGRAEILAALAARMGNDAGIEFETALSEIERIALLRLEDIFGEECERA